MAEVGNADAAIANRNRNRGGTDVFIVRPIRYGRRTNNAVVVKRHATADNKNDNDVDVLGSTWDLILYLPNRTDGDV